MFKCVELKFPSLSIRRNFELFKNVFETLKNEVEHFLLFLKLELLLYLNYVKNWGFQYILLNSIFIQQIYIHCGIS